MFQIEKKVPFGGTRNGNSLFENFVNTMMKMSVGDSFVFPKENNYVFHNARRSVIKFNPGVEFKARTTEKGGKKMRVWRIK